MLYTQKFKYCMQKVFFKKSLFEYKNQFAIEKNKEKNFGGNFKKNFEKFLSSLSKKS